MPEPKSFEDQIRDLYHFFVSAESNNWEVTYDQIQERLVDRKYDTLVWYANNFWTWFLSKKEEKRGRYRVFMCQGLARYPEAFFVAAHLNSQGQYFYHFGRALNDSRERAKIRKQAKEQAGQPQPELPEPPTEVGQEFPEELHFADNETEEMEGSEPTDITAHTEASATPGGPAPSVPTTPTTREPSPEISFMERITDMLGFSRKDREAVDQLRTEVVTLVQTLAQERDQLRNQITSELQTVLPRLRADFADQVQVVKQDLANAREQFRKEFTGRIEELTEGSRQSNSPPDFSPIHTDLANQVSYLENKLTAVIKQSPDLALIRAELDRSSEDLQKTLLTEIQQSHIIPEFLQVAAEMTKLQTTLNRLATQVSQLVPQRPDSTEQSIHTQIQIPIDKAHDALRTLEDVHTAWLKEQTDLWQELHQAEQQEHNRTHRLIQTIGAHLSLNGEEPPDGTVIHEKETVAPPADDIETQ